MAKAALKGLARSALAGAIVLGPGLVLVDDEPVLGSFWLLFGSFGLMAWTYRRPWRMMWVTCLLPPIGAGAAYAAQLVFLPGEPDLHFVGIALAIGIAIGVLRGRAHRVYREPRGIFAQRTMAYLGVWILCYAITQFFAFQRASGMVSVGRVGGAFSTAMLATVCVVLLARYLRERRQPVGRDAQVAGAGLAILAVVLALPLASRPAAAQVIANGCTITAYPDPASPGSRAVFIQQTRFNQPRTGDVYHFVYVIQNPDASSGRSIIARLWPDQVPPIEASDSYAVLLARAQQFCRERAVRTTTEIVGEQLPEPGPPPTVPGPPPALPPSGPPPGGAPAPGTAPFVPYVPGPSSRPSTRTVAEAAANVSIILIVTGIGVSVASSIGAAIAGSVQAVAESAAQEIGEAVGRAEAGAPHRRAGPIDPQQDAGAGEEHEPERDEGNAAAARRAPSAREPAIARDAAPGLAGDSLEVGPGGAGDLAGRAADASTWVWDELSNPNNWWGVGRSLDDASKAVGAAGWDNTDLGWGVSLVTIAASRAAGELADLPRQAVEAAGSVWDLGAHAAGATWEAATDPENRQAAWETIRDLVGFVAGLQGPRDKVASSIESGAAGAAAIAGHLIAAARRDPEGAAVAVIKALIGADNWEKSWDPDVPLLERLGRAGWAAVDTSTFIWGIGTAAANAPSRISGLIRGADATADLAAGARAANQVPDLASAGRQIDTALDGSSAARAAQGAGAGDVAVDAARSGRAAGEAGDAAAASRSARSPAGGPLVDGAPGGRPGAAALPDHPPGGGIPEGASAGRAAGQADQAADAGGIHAAGAGPPGQSAPVQPGATPGADGYWDAGQTDDVSGQLDDVLQELQQGGHGIPSEIVADAPRARVVSQVRSQGCVPAAAAGATGADVERLDTLARARRGGAIDPNVRGLELEEFLRDAGLQPRVPTAGMRATLEEVDRLQRLADTLEGAPRAGVLRQSAEMVSTLRPAAGDLVDAVNTNGIVAGLRDRGHFVSIQAGRRDAAGRAWFQLVDPDPDVSQQVQWVLYDDLVRRINWTRAWQVSPP